MQSVEFTGGGLLAGLAQLTGQVVVDNGLTLAAPFGTGYVKHFVLGPDLQVLVTDVTLHQALRLQKAATPAGEAVVVFSFRQLLGPEAVPPPQLPSAQVSSADMSMELVLPAGQTFNSILISVRASLLHERLPHPAGQAALRALLTGPGPYCYEQLLSPEIRQAARRLVQAQVPAPLAHYFYRLRAEELIFLLLAELFKRPAAPAYPLHPTDVRRLYALKATLLADLSCPPSLPALARSAGMSARKMQRLFKQVFGATIYHYYQHMRVQQAAYLLREQHLSVAEAGHQVGFTNLSHFARLFEQQLGTTPKKYASAGLSSL